MVREIRGAKINPKSFFKNWGAQHTRGRKLREQIPHIRLLVSGLSQRRIRFQSWPLCVRFVVDKVTLGKRGPCSTQTQARESNLWPHSGYRGPITVL